MGEGGGMGRIEEKETSAQDEPTNLIPQTWAQLMVIKIIKKNQPWRHEIIP